MRIELPVYQESYSNKVIPEAYTKAQNLLDRTILIYEKYCESGDSSLYSIFWDTLNELELHILPLSQVIWHELDYLVKKLAVAAECVVADDKVYRSTMLYDLAACIDPNH